MRLLNNKVYTKDLDYVLAQHDFSPLNGKSVLVTGATGLIGSAIVDLLLRYSEYQENDIRIYIAARSAEKVEERFGMCDYLQYMPYDALKPVNFDFHTDFIIHAASNASPDAYMKDPVGTMMSNFLGLDNLLRYGLQCKAEKTVYISSSEVYGRKDSAGAYSEMDYGFVDLLNARSSYPMGKRASETLCASYAAQYGSSFSIARPGHVYGPTATTRDKRVSSAFAYLSAKGQDITMKSEGTQLRSYCYCVDCASAVLQILLYGRNGEAYNISNSSSVITIRRMAEILADAGNVQLLFELPSAAEKAAFNPMDNSSLTSDKLESIGWKGLFTAEEGLSHTVNILKSFL